MFHKSIWFYVCCSFPSINLLIFVEHSFCKHLFFSWTGASCWFRALVRVHGGREWYSCGNSGERIPSSGPAVSPSIPYKACNSSGGEFHNFNVFENEMISSVTSGWHEWSNFHIVILTLSTGEITCLWPKETMLPVYQCAAIRFRGRGTVLGNLREEMYEWKSLGKCENNVGHKMTSIYGKKYKHFLPIKCHVIHRKLLTEGIEKYRHCAKKHFMYSHLFTFFSGHFYHLYFRSLQTKSAFVERHASEFFLSSEAVSFFRHLRCWFLWLDWVRCNGNDYGNWIQKNSIY